MVLILPLLARSSSPAVSDVPPKQTTWPFSSDEDGDLTSLIRDNNKVIDLTLFDDLVASPSQDFTDLDHTGNGTAFPSASPVPSASPAPASPSASPAPPAVATTPKKTRKTKKRRRDATAVSCNAAFLAIATDDDSNNDPAAAAAAPPVSPAVLRRRRRQRGLPRRLRYLTDKNAELKARALHLRCQLTRAESRTRDLEARNSAHAAFFKQQASQLGFAEAKSAALAQYVSLLTAHHRVQIHPSLVSVCAGSAHSAPVASTAPPPGLSSGVEPRTTLTTHLPSFGISAYPCISASRPTPASRHHGTAPA